MVFTRKSIYFYDIAIRLKPMTEVIKTETIFHTILKTHANNIITEDNYTIDVLENNEEYFYASYGLLKEDFRTLLTRERDPQNKKEIKYSENQGIKIVENYTYFYINYKHSAMAILRNDHAPTPKNYIENFLASNMHLLQNNQNIFIFEDLKIYDMLISDIKEKINKLKKATELKFEFTERLSSSFMPSISEIYQEYENDIRKLYLTLNFKNEVNIQSLRKKLTKISETYDNIKSLKLTGIFSDSEIEEVIDVIRRTLTRHVEIELDSKAPRSKEENERIEKIIFDTMKDNLLAQIIRN